MFHVKHNFLFESFNGEDLRNFRFALGREWTLNKLGKEIGFSGSYISLLEKRQSCLPEKVVWALNRAFNATNTL